MSRALPMLLALAAPSAHAGGLLAGGFQGAPSVRTGALSGMPALKLGFGSRELVGYGSLGLAHGRLKEHRQEFWIESVNGTAVQPMLGVRAALGAHHEMVLPFVEAGAYTRIWALGSDSPDVDLPEQDAGASLRPVVGGVLGLGLDARLSPNLSFSVALGIDAFTAGYVYDNYVYHLDTLTTWSALHVNIWL